MIFYFLFNTNQSRERSNAGIVNQSVKDTVDSKLSFKAKFSPLPLGINKEMASFPYRAGDL